MRRRQLVEIEDLAWCPRAVRDGGTDWLRFIADSTRMFSAVVPKIYLEDELRELVARVPGFETFTWDIGTTSLKGMPSGIPHLVGIPNN